MLKRLSTHLNQFSTGSITLLALIIFLLFTALVLPAQSSKAEEVTRETATPDLSLFYSPQELYQMAEAYGPDGRSAYIHARWTFDVVWPLVCTFFLVTSISWVMVRAFPTESRCQIANLLPVLGALLDYLENASTSLVMARYPLSTPVVDMLAIFFTLFKWIFVNGSIVLLLVGLALTIWMIAGKSQSGFRATKHPVFF